MTGSEKLIKAEDFMPNEDELAKKAKDYQNKSEPTYEDLMMSDEVDGVLMGIFGDMPDYSDPKIEALWQEIMDSENEKFIDFCAKNGVDVIGKDGHPIVAWRDIAVMLLAIERGLISRK